MSFKPFRSHKIVCLRPKHLNLRQQYYNFKVPKNHYFDNDSRVFVAGNLFQPGVMLGGKARSLPNWSPKITFPLDLHTHIRPARRGLQRINTLAYYRHS